MNSYWGTDLQAVGDALRAAFDTFGYPLTFFGALLENTVFLGLILPGGSMVLASAAYARLGDLQWPAVLLLGWTGMVLGNCIDYWLGRKALRPLLDRFGRRRQFIRSHVRARRFLARHGIWAIAAGHFLGHVRSFIAIAAGSSRFPFPRYLVLEVPAALAWNLLYCSLGYLLAARLDVVRTVFERIGLFGAIGIGLAVVALLAVRRARLASANAIS